MFFSPRVHQAYLQSSIKSISVSYPVSFSNHFNCSTPASPTIYLTTPDQFFPYLVIAIKHIKIWWISFNLVMDFLLLIYALKN